MTYEQVQELINDMTDDEFESVLIVANERVSDWDCPHPYVELAKSAMAAVVIGAAGPASGVADELPEVLDDMCDVMADLRYWNGIDMLAGAFASMSKSLDPYEYADQYDSDEEAVRDARNLLRNDDGMSVLAETLNRYMDVMESMASERR